MKMPTWGWYVIGAVIIVGVLYFLSRGRQQGSQTVPVTTPDVMTYNAASDSLAQLLGAQAKDLTHLQQFVPGSTVSIPGSPGATISGPGVGSNPGTIPTYTSVPTNA